MQLSFFKATYQGIDFIASFRTSSVSRAVQVWDAENYHHYSALVSVNPLDSMAPMELDFGPLHRQHCEDDVFGY